MIDIIKPQPQWRPPVAISAKSGPLQGAVFLGQRWRDLTFLHWRVAESMVAPLLPVGTRPDVYDGTSWVGLIPFRLTEARFGHGPPLPYVGSFAELNVRLYSVDADGRRGVVFRSLEASRLAFVLGARWALGLNYTWARMQVEERDGVVSYRSRRRWPAPKGAASRVVVRIGNPDVSDVPLATFLTARWGLHTHHRGRLLYLPNTHRAVAVAERRPDRARRRPRGGCWATRCDLAAARLGAVLPRCPDRLRPSRNNRHERRARNEPFRSRRRPSVKGAPSRGEGSTRLVRSSTCHSALRI